MNTSSFSAVRMICLDTLTLVSTHSATAQEAAEKIPQPGISSRACTGAPNLRSCLEVHAPPLEIREYLRAFAREQKWRMAREASSADSWTFTRYLEKEELAQVAKTDALGGRVNWIEGKAFVVVKNVDAGD